MKEFFVSHKIQVYCKNPDFTLLDDEGNESAAGGLAFSIFSATVKMETDEMFAKVHGDMTLHYTVYEDKNVVLLETITPEDILTEGHRTELPTYKGVMISKANAEKDMFKINLLNMLER